MELNRREFCQTVAAAGAGLAAVHPALGQVKADQAEKKKGIDDLNVALIGAGAEGRILIEATKNIPGIRYKAVCDIWKYSQLKAQSLLRRDHSPVIYEDYRVMLEKEKDLDAVIVASPDWVHAEHSNACMEAGLHVYCEKEMSNSLEKARSMVETSRRTKKLLQIGHQRRSNPRYIHAFDTLIHEMNLLGRVTHAQAQWNRSKTEDLGWNRAYTMSPEKLHQYGYDTMSRFMNWRWYKRYGGGPIVDLGSHQIDLFAWVFGVNPKSVIASGGIDYFHHHEWYDNVLSIFEYENDQGVSRAFYETLTTTKHGGFSEVFMGEDGAAVISEVPPQGNWVEREDHAQSWDSLVANKLLLAKKEAIQAVKTKNTKIDARVSPPASKYPFPVELSKPAHQPHLENFFNAIRNGEPLNCPGEIGYETAVAVLAVNKAVETGKKINFAKSEFHV